MYVTLEICRRSDAKPFSGNPVHADPPNRTDPAVAAKTVGQCDVLQRLAGNRAIPRIVRIVHTPAADAANSTPMWVHLLPDRIQHRLDWKMVAVFGIDLSRTVECVRAMQLKGRQQRVTNPFKNR